jgi:hypothetical protein
MARKTSQGKIFKRKNFYPNALIFFAQANATRRYGKSREKKNK